MDLISPEIMASTFFGNTVFDYVFCLLLFVVLISAMKIFKYIVVSRLKTLFEKTKNDLDDVFIHFIDRINWYFYVIVSMYVSLQFLNVPGLVSVGIEYLLIVAIVFYAVKALHEVIDYGSGKIIEKRQQEEKKTDHSVILFLNQALKIGLWFVAAVLILSNIGFDVTTLVAGLGIGGIAIAFALQNILVDIFASFSIYFNKPFRVGDFIVVGTDSGTVKEIGIKSTKIKTLQGQELIISNKELTEARVNNYKKMEKRRVVFPFGVTYDTPVKKLKSIPGMVEKIIEKEELADFSRAHFKNFGDFSLNFEVVYFVSSGDYNKFMDTQQSINFTIKEQFEKAAIEMAFPTQTIYLNRDN
ncbi:MAG: mechanosensitive ion channel family protein [Candidatus Diapherotrites archaeon]|nr:mechanosensitive ion channel family protein [Candidatus Diapherotrites archaeon]